MARFAWALWTMANGLYRFRLRSKNDAFKKMFENLSSDADMQDASIDNTSCKVHQHAAGAADALDGAILSGSAVMDDKAYGTAEIRQFIETSGGSYRIPSKIMLSNLQRFCRAATRYDKLSRIFLSFAFLASAMILLK